MNRRQKLVQKQFLNNEKAVIDRLQYIYDQSLFEISEKIRNLEFSIGDLQEQYDWLEDDDPKREIIRSKIQAKIYQKQYQQVLQDQVGGILKEMQTKQFVTISDYLDTCYEDGFVGALFDLHGQDVPMMMPIDQESMVRAIQLDSKISEGLYTRLGEDVTVLKKRITSEITRSIATGVSWERVAQRLAGQTKIGYNKAVRIARTEGHRVQCTAADDVAHKARDMGADVVKQWDATLDGKTRPSHRAVDGEIKELDERFSNGLLFPGHPDGAAGEVINCRCAYLQRARWALEAGFTKMNNFTKQLETFDSPEAYEEFKKGFFSDGNVKYMNYVQQMQDKYGTRDMRKLLEQMSEREYKHYSRLLNGNPLFNAKAPVKPSFIPAKTLEEAQEYARSLGVDADYSKYNLDVANAVNEAMHGIQDTFGTEALNQLHRVGTFPQGYSTRWKGAYVQGGDADGSLWLRNVNRKDALEKLASVAKGQYDVGYWSTPEALHIIRHELGHAIHRAIGTPEINAQINALRKGIQDERLRRNRSGDRNHAYSDWLSEYGMTNIKEFVAESIAEYLAGNPRETAKKVVEILMGGK
jgi:uncharacterized protein with gpF-like domain